MNRKFVLAAAAAFPLAALLSQTGFALSVAKGSFQVSPRTVQLSRTFTVSVVLEDDEGQGGLLETSLEPRPARLVQLVSETPPSFSCTPSGSSRGLWVYRAIGPGEVSFHLNAVLLSCTLAKVVRAEADSPAVRLEPPKIWSDLKIIPRIAAPGDEIEVTLLLRNDARAAIEYPLPQAQVQLQGMAGPAAEPAGEMRIEPAGIVSGDRMRLPAGQTARAFWKFIALRTGEVRFFISGAGLLIMSPPTQVRFPPALELVFEAPREAWTVGRVFPLTGRVRARGEPGILDPAVNLSISPPGAARGVAEPVPIRGLLASGEDGRPLEYSVELLQAGELHFTLSATGREADTGRPAQPHSVELVLEVLPPPDLQLKMNLDSATTIAGGKVYFSLDVVNRGISGAASLSPSISFPRGRAQLEQFSPLFQAVPFGATGTFRGALVPEQAGEVEVIAQVSTRGEQGGKRVAFSSVPSRLLVLPAPLIELKPVPARAFPGPGRVSFILCNAGSLGIALDSAALRLTGGGYELRADLLVKGQLKLGPGESATLSAATDTPAAADPYWLTGSFSLSGILEPYGIAFDSLFSPRLSALICPAARRFVMIEPPAPFRPPLDPVLHVEWTLTAAGTTGLAVIGPAGETVRVLAQPRELQAGAHSAHWHGRDAGDRLVPAGRYLLRLAGEAPEEAAWPAGASWTVDSPLNVERP